MPSQDVCLSVARQYSLDTAEHILKMFLPPGSPTILVFSHLSGWQYSDGNTLPVPGRRMQGGHERNQDFRPISRFVPEMMQDSTKVTSE